MSSLYSKLTSYFFRNYSTSGRPPYYQLKHKHVKNVVVLPTRQDMLEKLPKNAIVAEVGVAKGRFSEKILKTSTPQTLHLIDSWRSKAFNNKAEACVKNKFKDPIDQGVVQIHQGKSTKILKSFPDHHIDWIYLDTDHTYNTTKEELEICKVKVKKGGIIAGHDYTTRNYRTGDCFGVVEAVNEFCFKNDWEFIYLTHETHRHLSFALKKLK